MERVASRCVSLLAQRRGYSVAAAMVKGTGRSAEDKTAVAAKRTMAAKKDTASVAAVEEKTAWVPDPVTGYYRPAGLAKQMDAAELSCAPSCAAKTERAGR